MLFVMLSFLGCWTGFSQFDIVKLFWVFRGVKLLTLTHLSTRWNNWYEARFFSFRMRRDKRPRNPKYYFLIQKSVLIDREMLWNLSALRLGDDIYKKIRQFIGKKMLRIYYLENCEAVSKHYSSVLVDLRRPASLRAALRSSSLTDISWEWGEDVRPD